MQKFLCQFFLIFVGLVFVASSARAFDLYENTHLIGIRQGSKLSERVSSMSRGGYELAGGGFVDFRRFYRQNWIEMRFDFLTQVHENVGFIWGVSTGERGDKYAIAPGAKIGFIIQVEPSRQSSLSFSITTILGGRLKERSCLADYGDIGGVAHVNCRLAASELPPGETLKYAVNMRPPDHTWVGFRYQLRF